MHLEIRSCRDEELAPFLHTVEAAFGEEPHPEDLETLHIFDADRCIYMAEGDAMVGTAGAFPFMMSVPGGDLPTAGVTVVGVLPTHRRRGILTRLMAHQLNDVHQRGEVLAALWASEGTIYGRYGYGIASLQGGIHLERDRARFRDDPGASGRVRLLPRDEAAKAFDPIYEQVRRSRPGMYSRSEDFWSLHTLVDSPHYRHGGGPLFCALHEDSGTPDAYAFYRVHHDWSGVPSSQVVVREALGLGAQATREIWRFLFSIDLIQTVEARSLPLDHPLYLMLEEPRRMRQTVGDALWLRIVDVPSALKARSYAAAGRVVLGIEDRWCPWNTGSWVLDTTGSDVSVTRTEEEAEVTLTPSDLASVYLGAFTPAQLERAGRAEPGPGLATLEAMLRTTIAPYCSGTF